jgi:hypothetical protein
MDEVYCNDYNWEVFFRISSVIVPKLLKQVHKNSHEKFKFCVIGGKAVDAHISENYIGSPDWDIDTTDKEKFTQFIKSSIERQMPFVKIFSNTVDKNGEIGIQLGIDSGNCVLRFMDVFQFPTIEYEVVQGIPYLPKKKLMIQLFQILNDRRALYKQAMVFGSRDEENQTAIAQANENIQKSKNNLLNAFNKFVEKKITFERATDKIQEFMNSIEDYSGEKRRLQDAVESTAKLDINLKIQKSLQKLEKTKKRLQTLAEQNRGYVSEVCQDCSKNIGKTIDSVSCDLINTECTDFLQPSLRFSLT